MSPAKNGTRFTPNGPLQELLVLRHAKRSAFMYNASTLSTRKLFWGLIKWALKRSDRISSRFIWFRSIALLEANTSLQTLAELFPRVQTARLNPKEHNPLSPVGGQ